MSGDHEWHEWRRGGIGGSDIAGLLGLSSFSSPYKVWAEKVGLLEPTESTQRQRIGQRMEPVLAAEFHDATDLYVAGEQTQCTDPEASWRRCTIDGFVTDWDPFGLGFGDAGDALGTVEFKTDGRFGWPDGVPANIRAQAVWQMGVTHLAMCWVVVMFAGFRVETFEIAWDLAAREDWALMTERADAFWTDHVMTGEPPPMDGSDATSGALATIYPDHTPGVVVDLDDLADELTERADLKEAIKADKARLDEIENVLKARIGDAEQAAVGGIPILTYRQQTNAAHFRAESTFRVLRPAPKPKNRKGS